jgi:predicted nucleic acid-binding protein
MIIVADTSPPLHLGRVRRHDRQPAAVARVTIPRTVWRELVQPGTRGDVVEAIEAADWIDVVDDPVARDLGLDPGETAAILLAEHLRADALLIDERRGRAVATARGIAVIGTLGIVAGARRLGMLERAAPVVAELRADGFWLSDAVVAEFLGGLGESP